MGVDHADAVGAEKADVVFLGDGGQLCLEPDTIPAHFGKSPGDNDGMPDALLAAGLQGFGHDFCGQHQYGQVRCCGQVGDGTIGIEALDPFFPGVHRVKRAGKSYGLDRIEDARPHGAGIVGGSEDGDAARIGDFVKGTVLQRCDHL